MRRADRAAADIERRGNDALCPEELERVHGADDIDDRIERADLVEVDPVGRRTVDRSFDLSKPRKQRLCAIFSCGAQPRAFDQRVNFPKRPMRMRLGGDPAVRMALMSLAAILAAHLEFCRADAGTIHTFGPD